MHQPVANTMRYRVRVLIGPQLVVVDITARGQQEARSMARWLAWLRYGMFPPVPWGACRALAPEALCP